MQFKGKLLFTFKQEFYFENGFF